MILTDVILDDLINKIAMLELTGKANTKLSKLRQKLIDIQTPISPTIITPESVFGAGDGEIVFHRINKIPLIAREKIFDSVIIQLSKSNPELLE